MRTVTAAPVSAASRSHCRWIAAGRSLVSAAGVNSATIARASARFSRAVVRDQLDVSLRRSGVGFQLGLDGLSEHHDAGESLCQGVVDLPRQPFPFGRGARIPRQPSALGAGRRQLGDQCRPAAGAAASTS